MPIQYKSLEDPFGIGALGKSLGAGLQKRGELQQSQLKQALKEAKEKNEAQQEYSFLKPFLPEGAPDTLPEGVSAKGVRTLGQLAQQPFEKESEKLSAQNAMEFVKDTRKSHRDQKQRDLVYSQMLDKARSGKLSNPLVVNALDKAGLPLGVLKNPDSESFKSLEKQLIAGLKEAFGGRINQAEFKAWMEGVPQLMNSDKGKEEIIRVLRLLDQPKTLRYDAMREIMKESGGKVVGNIEDLVEDRIGSKLDSISSEFEFEVPGGEKGLQQVEPGTQVTTIVVDELLRKHGGDIMKAKAEATELGYSF